MDSQGGVIDRFRRLLGLGGVVSERTDMIRHLRDWAGDAQGAALAVLRPSSVAQVQETLGICHAHGLAVIPQGGNTGLVMGAFSDLSTNSVIISLERLNTIRAVDPENFILRADAGCTLQAIKDAAAAADCLFPLAMGAQGSCQIGGNVATNAGGINVLRYGMARDLILGLEVVLPDGELWSGLSGLRKDNRGYDLKQLFIGAEGTLGIVTGVEFKLFPQPARVETAYVGVGSFEDAMALFARARRVCSDLVTGFEVIGTECLAAARLIDPTLVAPVAEAIPVHIVLEVSASEAIDARAMVEKLLSDAMAAGLVINAALAQSKAQARAFWALREGLVEGQARRGYHVRTDLSVVLGDVPALIARARALIASDFPGWLSQAYGHAGDGNVHFNVLPPAEMAESEARETGREITAALYELAHAFGGSISAEHGIGRTRRDVFWASLPPAQRRLIKAVKSALDPAGLMNPDCLIPSMERRS